MDIVVKQYDVFKIKKSRCVVISPNEMNAHIATVIIAPMTTKSYDYPTRVALKFQNKNGWIVLDQIRTVDKKRLVKKLGYIDAAIIHRVRRVIKEMLVD